jgi:hypothetical protein
MALHDEFGFVGAETMRSGMGTAPLSDEEIAERVIRRLDGVRA